MVPTRGRDDLLALLLEALAGQTLPRERWGIVLSFDGCSPSARIADRLRSLNGLAVVSERRGGPGAARNRGVREAAGDVLAFTEDDCVPAREWLAAAAARFDREPGLDVLEGATLLPSGRPVRRRDLGRLTWLPTNLFVHRGLFERIGGYEEAFFDGARGIYFREDSDFGFTATAAGARTAFEPGAHVIHPREHRGWLDPIRWARRYEMDALLAARHPRAFREEIEVVRFGPIGLRRPFVRICIAYAITLAACLVAYALRNPGVASWFACAAALALLALWGKWGFAPARLPLLPIVPLVLLASLVRGRRRAASAASGAGR